MDKRLLAVQMIVITLQIIVYGIPIIIASEVVNRVIDWVAAIW